MTAMLQQQTVSTAFTLEGVGIHTGAPGRVTVQPAAPNTGRVFLTGGRRIPARLESVKDTTRCTVLGRGRAQVSTVEHLLSALCAFGIDNALIKVEGPEVPILDGSALPFAEAIRAVGVRKQNAPARLLTLRESVPLREGASEGVAEPAECLCFEVAVSFADWPEGEATVRAEVGSGLEQEYCRTVAPARTFAFRKEVEWLLNAGLARGGSLDNALIITPPNTFSTPLRLPQEWAAHKLLDAIGDLALLDARLNATIRLVRPGHRFNTELARRIQAVAAEIPKGECMSPILNVEDIRALLPHRYPMLLVDQILEIVPGKKVVGKKNITINEPFFTGHFPGQAMMPGVLTIEAMAQVAGLMMLALPEQEGKLAVIAAIEKARFRKPLVPGDTLITEAEIIWVRGSMGKAQMVGKVDGEVVAECEITFAMRAPTPSTVHEKLALVKKTIKNGNSQLPHLAGGPLDDKSTYAGDSHDSQERGREIPTAPDGDAHGE